MSLSVNTNIAALQAHNNLSNTDVKLTSAMQKLSSGFRINTASDDAAGLAISNKLNTNIRSLTVASQNVSQAKAMVGVAEGSADQIEAILERMKELATEAASANTGTDTDKTQAEFASLQSEIDRIAQSTTYQGTALLTGAFGSALDTVTTGTHSTALAGHGLDAVGVNAGGASLGTFTITETAVAGTTAGTVTMAKGGVSQTVNTTGAGIQTLNFSALGVTLTTNSSFANGTALNATQLVVGGTQATYQVGSSANAYDQIQVSLGNLQGAQLGVDAASANVSTVANAQAALTSIDNALSTVNNVLGTIGATVNRLNYTANNLQSTISNFSASESAIKDVDMAAEMTQFTKSQILEQAGTAMLAQANSSSQNILSLFK